jgi:hypothetical protein
MHLCFGSFETIALPPLACIGRFDLLGNCRSHPYPYPKPCGFMGLVGAPSLNPITL